MADGLSDAVHDLAEVLGESFPGVNQGERVQGQNGTVWVYPNYRGDVVLWIEPAAHALHQGKASVTLPLDAVRELIPALGRQASGGRL